MRNGVLTSVVVFLLWAGAQARAEEPKALVDKAIAAHGGAERLAAYKAGSYKAKGTINLMGNEVEAELESYFQLPDRGKSVLKLKIMCMEITQTSLVKGNTASVTVNDMDIPLDDKLKQTILDGLYVERLMLLLPLKEPGIELLPLGDGKVDGKNTAAIKVKSRGKPDVELHFDKTSGLLLKAEHRVFDPMTGEEVTQERIYDEYKEIQGIQVPMKLVVNRDGNKLLKMEMTDSKILDRLDDSVFEK